MRPQQHKEEDEYLQIFQVKFKNKFNNSCSLLFAFFVFDLSYFLRFKCLKLK
jgi:hypothetical protein